MSRIWLPAPTASPCEALGFKRYVREEILVNSGEVPRIDLQLEVGAMAESVTVTSASPLLETETSSSRSDHRWRRVD